MKRKRVMKTPPQFVLSRLSRGLYIDFLTEANQRGFSFVQFRDFLSSRQFRQPYIVLRHDIDFAPRYSLEMAQLEHDAAIKSTFFVLVDGQFYNPLQSDVIRQLRQIHALGHEIGLHFAVASAVDSDIGKEVAFRLGVLTAIVGDTVQSFSQHDPVNAGFAPVELPPEHHPVVNATRVIQDNDLLYVSDSAMMWRRHTFETALSENRNLCLLAHPHSWLHHQDDYVAMIREIESCEAQAVSERYDSFVNALEEYYRRRLNEGV